MKFIYELCYIQNITHNVAYFECRKNNDKHCEEIELLKGGENRRPDGQTWSPPGLGLEKIVKM